MAILLMLVPISLVLLGVAVWALVWAIRSGQYDDLDSPAIDILRSDSADAHSPDAREPTADSDAD